MADGHGRYRASLASWGAAIDDQLRSWPEHPSQLDSEIVSSDAHEDVLLELGASYPFLADATHRRARAAAKALTGAANSWDYQDENAYASLLFALRRTLATVVELTGDGPPEAMTTEWSRPMSKSEAARLLECPVRKKAEWMTKCIEDGIYRARQITRQQYEFDLGTIDQSVREKFRRSASTAAASVHQLPTK